MINAHKKNQDLYGLFTSGSSTGGCPATDSRLIMTHFLFCRISSAFLFRKESYVADRVSPWLLLGSLILHWGNMTSQMVIFKSSLLFLTPFCSAYQRSVCKTRFILTRLLSILIIFRIASMFMTLAKQKTPVRIRK